MIEEILIAGFGGQGVILAGRLLAEAALAEGKQVVCTVSYGPEMRGGTANSGVIISDEPIGSLVVIRPTVAVVMNEPSMAKFEPMVRTGGLLVVNQSLVPYRCQRQDIAAIYIPATDLAMELGNKEVANIILLGVLVAARAIVDRATLASTLPSVIARAHPDLVAINQQALRLGLDKGDEISSGTIIV